jgi:hypothetical protein
VYDADRELPTLRVAAGHRSPTRPVPRLAREALVFDVLIGQVGPYAATIVVGFFSGFLPFVNIEIYVLAAAAIAGADYPVWTLGAAAGFGQMFAKSMLFFGAHSALRSRAGRRVAPGRVDALRARLQAMNPVLLGAFNFTSALVGVPPFLVVSIVAGAVGMRFGVFYATGLVGRSLRLIVIAQFPHLIHNLFA